MESTCLHPVCFGGAAFVSACGFKPFSGRNNGVHPLHEPYADVASAYVLCAHGLPFVLCFGEKRAIHANAGICHAFGFDGVYRSGRSQNTVTKYLYVLFAGLPCGALRTNFWPGADRVSEETDGAFGNIVLGTDNRDKTVTGSIYELENIL